MADSTREKVRRSLEAAEEAYHRLVLLVGASGSGKTRVLADVANGLGARVINVNLALSEALLDLTAKQRSLRLPEILNRIADSAQSPVVFDNLEILFDQDLRQDPLRLLHGVSRNHTVVASWNGAVIRGKLVYAEAGHSEYRRYDSPDALIVSMDETVGGDVAKNNEKVG